MLRTYGLSQVGKEFRVVNVQRSSKYQQLDQHGHSNEAYTEPIMMWKWNYEHKFRSNVVDYRLPRVEDIDRANWGSFTSSITFIVPRLQGSRGLKKTDLSTVDETTQSRTISWIMQTETVPESFQLRSPVSPRKETTGNKYLRAKNFFVTEAQEIGFPETAADFVLTNLEHMATTWRDNIREAEKRMEFRHSDILEKNGTDWSLIQKLLRDLRMFNEWKKIIAGHIVCCEKLRKILQDENLPFIREDEVYCAKWGVSSAVVQRMAKVQKKIIKYSGLVGSLVKTTENYVTLVRSAESWNGNDR